MGYLGNHLATVTTGVFAAILTGLWPWFHGWAPLLDFVFIMSVPITWFLTATCWLSQKSVDYMHKHGPEHAARDGKKNPNSGAQQKLVYDSDGKQVTPGELKEAKTELTDELNSLRDTVKIRDSEIERLKQEIANLETLVQIESLKTELANLRMLASKK